ncbi:hypothetical protein BJV77DRAFT_675778 [Russula vinacea]|nr:hypothetical protein BJV77DRAFT_675778 [Russula vinacea]
MGIRQCMTYQTRKIFTYHAGVALLFLAPEFIYGNGDYGQMRSLLRWFGKLHDKLVDEWDGLILWSTVMLSANVAFLLSLA